MAPTTHTRSMPPTALVRLNLRLETQTYRYRTPMKFGGRIVEDVTVADVTADVENAAGGNARGDVAGLGSMTMGVAWAWPDASIDDATKLAAVLQLIQRMIDAAHQDGLVGHPMEICLRLSQHHRQLADAVTGEMGLACSMPDLAVLLAASPIEAALFDGHGKAANQSAYELLGPEHLTSDLGQLLHREEFAGLTMDQFVTDKPVASLPLYHLVGALDPLTDADVDELVDDGYPETLGQWIKRNELTHLKVKLNGDDPDWDRQRVQAIDAVAQSTQDRGASQGKPWQYSLDFNERCEDEEYVLKLLDDLRRESPETLARVQYIEQPTHRDLTRPDAVTMHRAAAQIPVVIDESLTNLASLDLAIEQGYSGIALKACKGHAEALLLGAVAQHRKLFLCTQDLTCIGASLLHSASLSAHLPGVAAVESNGRQYCPAGNSEWLASYEPLFEIRSGSIPTGLLDGPGLGY
ncbi:MAG: mandelate racemase/muconate lactonizing enzyme family protein [Planctomycetota bacterium]